MSIYGEFLLDWLETRRAQAMLHSNLNMKMDLFESAQYQMGQEQAFAEVIEFIKKTEAPSIEHSKKV